MYEFNTILIRFTVVFSVTGQIILKFRWKNKCANIPKVFLKKERVEGGFSPL